MTLSMSSMTVVTGLNGGGGTAASCAQPASATPTAMPIASGRRALVIEPPRERSNFVKDVAIAQVDRRHENRAEQEPAERERNRRQKAEDDHGETPDQIRQDVAQAGAEARLQRRTDFGISEHDQRAREPQRHVQR